MTPRFRLPISLLCCLFVIFALGTTPLFAQITFTDFTSTSGLVLNGSATTVGPIGQKVLRLTADGQSHVSGTAWSSTRQNVAAGFTSIFQFQITHTSTPADGIAFVIQNSAAATAARGGSGGAIGYGAPDPGDNGTAIPNSLAVEFDTFTNAWDPDANHIAVQSCGTGPNTQKHDALCPSSAPSNLGILNSASLGINLSDGLVHKVIIEYDPSSTPSAPGTLRVFVDNTAVPKLSVNVNLTTLLSLTDSQNAYVGFTGSVGGSSENNDILNWTFTPASVQTSVSQPLSTTGDVPSTDAVFGSYNHKVLNYFTTNSDQLTVTAIPETQAQFLAELNGQFPGAHCLIYDGTGGLCVKFRVTCTSSSTDCENLDYEVAENFNNNNQGNPTILGAGMLKRKTPTGPEDFPTWSNIVETFSQSRLTDPGGKGKSTGFSEFILCSGCTAPPTIAASPANGTYVVSPSPVTFSCTPDPLAPNVFLLPGDTGCSATLNGVAVNSGASVGLNPVGSLNALVVSANDSVGNSNSLATSFYTGEPPAITSASSATFQVGVGGSFPVTATGFPTPTVTVTGALPSGVTFAGGALIGMPAAGTGGVYSLTITAHNVLSPDAVQAFTLTVNQPPAITSAGSATFSTSTANLFTVTSTGFPIPTLSATGVPAGLMFTPGPNGTGTATLSGTPGSSGSFTIVFTAQNSVSPNATQNFSLTVTGPQLSISPGSINFGDVPFLNLLTKNITVKNIGTTSVQISKVSLTRIQADLDDFTWLNLCPSNLNPGKSCTIAILFIADDLGPRSATLNIINNATGSPQGVPLSANVTNPKASFNPSSWNFGTQTVGVSSVKVITLSNPGNAPLAINKIMITGPNTTDFTVSHACPSSLAAGSSCAISVTFKPVAKGNRAAGLTVTDNMFPGIQVVPLTGKGN